jgi:hypothetical protein
MAQTKFTELTANTDIASADIVPMVDDPAGTPVTKKITGANLAASIRTLNAATATGADVAVVANVNVIGGVEVLHRITASALTGDVDVTLTHKTRVIDVWCVQTAAGGAGDTIIVKSGANAITDTMDCNKADNIITRAASLDDANWEIAAAGTLRITGASAVTCEVFVRGIRVA